MATKIVKGYCTDHPEEEIMYFCFDCKGNCICAECVVHGVHKNHEVKTIKRAFPIVKEQMEECLESLDYKIN